MQNAKIQARITRQHREIQLYLEERTDEAYRQTTWYCKDVGMPIEDMLSSLRDDSLAGGSISGWRCHNSDMIIAFLTEHQFVCERTVIVPKSEFMKYHEFAVFSREFCKAEIV